VVGALGERLGRAVALGTVRLARNPRAAYRIRARALAGRGDIAFLAARLTNFGPDAPPSVVEYAASVGSRAPLDVWAQLLTSLVEMDLRHALHQVRAPTLVLVGDVDRLTPPASARALQRELPDARLVTFPGSGHCTLLECPDAFNEVLEGFLLEHLPIERVSA
jgi:pimeloyl-ACP methyl ester carboxylesterase